MSKNYDTSCSVMQVENLRIETFNYNDREITCCRQCFEYMFDNYDMCCDKRFDKDLQSFLSSRYNNMKSTHVHCKKCKISLDPTTRDYHYFGHCHCTRCDSTSGIHRHCYVKTCDYVSYDEIQKCLHFHCPVCEELIVNYDRESDISSYQKSSTCRCGPINWDKYNLIN